MNTASAPTLLDAANHAAGSPLLGAIALCVVVVCVALAAFALAVESVRQGRIAAAVGWGALAPSTAAVIACGPILTSLPLSLALH